MKKIIAAILLFAMALTLFSCGAKPEFVEMNFSKISAVNFTVAKDADIDKKTFVDAYNKAEVLKKADEFDKETNEVIVVELAGGKSHFTIYYIGDNKFAVTGSVVENEYVIKAPELAEYYNKIVHPKAEFVAVDEKKVAESKFAVHADIEADTEAIVKAYNDAKFIGEAKNEKGSDVILIIYENGEGIFEITLVGENIFRVSGSLVEVDFIIESESLAKLYTEAVK